MKKLIIILVLCSSCAQQLHETKPISVEQRQQIAKTEKEKQQDRKRRNKWVPICAFIALGIIVTTEELRKE